MGKRLFDVCLSGCALIALVPVLFIVWVAVLVDSGFPAFFSQWRIGKGFRPFRLYKFRTMRPSLNGSSITVAGDPRVTRLGAFLRATKLDELPQLWNVVRGDMSLVGPRPEVAQYVELFRDRYARLLEDRPGVTDLASIRFRNEERILGASEDPYREYVDRILPAKLDLAEEYRRRRSILLDVSILLETLRVSLRNS